MNIYSKRIDAIKEGMRYAGIAAYIIPTGDPHNSEYIATYWKERTWASGFTGSAGTLLVTNDHAGLWTDSRYFIQAVDELEGSGIELHRLMNQGQDEYIGYLGDNLPTGAMVGCNGLYFTATQIQRFRRVLDKKGIKLNTNVDLLSTIWKDRPEMPEEPVFELDSAFTTRSRKDNIHQVLKVVHQKGANAHLLNTLDDICWLLNIRGYDVEFNPVAISYLLLTNRGHTLFIDPKKIDDKLAGRLADDNVHIMDYAVLTDFLQQLSDDVVLYIDPGTLNHEIYKEIHISTIEGSLPSRHLKAIKNEEEMELLRKVMVKDGVALLRMYRWLEATVAERGVTENEVVGKLAHFRSQQDHYYGESFGAIVGFKGNGAIVHYSPPENGSAAITGSGMLLVDSGGQYYDGTTDITRTTYFGTPSPEEKINFTRVLKGHIALAMVRFPEGTRGVQLDILARHALWQAGLNYGHGTGHGVGFFLNVHEPPQGFVPGLGARGTTAFEVGMYTSNEPGFYKEGAYGIRIENLVLTVPDIETEFGRFLKLETITLFPIFRDLIEVDLLSEAEVSWLNQYHDKVQKALSVHLNTEEQDWLEKACAPIG